MKAQFIFDPRLGIILYQNSVQNSQSLIDKLEISLYGNEDDSLRWNEAATGDQHKELSYRNCSDFKIDAKQFPWDLHAKASKLRETCSVVQQALTECLYDYEARYSIKMDFQECLNFVKYRPGQHFKPHADHGFSYNCTVSSVMYLNDNYEGGELVFNTLGFKIKPKAGDTIFFPSTYIYSHGSLPIIRGTKYSVVTMFDYNERTHKNFQYGHNLDGSPADPNAGKGLRFPNAQPSVLEPLDQDYLFTGIQQ